MENKTLNNFIKEIEEDLKESEQVGLMGRIMTKRSELEDLERYILKKLYKIRREIK